MQCSHKMAVFIVVPFTKVLFLELLLSLLRLWAHPRSLNSFWAASSQPVPELISALRNQERGEASEDTQGHFEVSQPSLIVSY